MRRRWRNRDRLSKFILNWAGLRPDLHLEGRIVFAPANNRPPKRGKCDSSAPRRARFRRIGMQKGPGGVPPRPLSLRAVARSEGGSAGRLGARGRFCGGFHRFGAAAGAPRPRQGDLHLVRGGDDGFHPAAVFFHGDAPTANLSGMGPTLGSVSPQFAAGIWPCLARLRFFCPVAWGNCGNAAPI